MVPVDVYDKLKSYAQAMDKPITSVIEEAIEDWLWTVGEARLEAQAGVVVAEVLMPIAANAALA